MEAKHQTRSKPEEKERKMAGKMAELRAKFLIGLQEAQRGDIRSLPDIADTTSASIMTYEKTKTRANMKGELYEIKMAALLFLRLANCETVSSFRLATNVEGAGALDDIVLTYTTTHEPTVKQSAFIQLKHKEKAILRTGSFSGKIGDFALRKYFKSYLDIKKCMLAHERPVIFDCDLENCHFVIHTNAPAHSELSGRLKVFGTCQLQDLISSRSARELIFKFSETSDGDIFSLIADVEETQEEAKEFLKSLTVYSGQPTESQLDHIIKEELLRACPGKTKTEVDLIYPFYENNIKDWWSHSNVILDQGSKILSEAIGKCKINTLSTLEEKYFCLDLRFQNIHSVDSLDQDQLVHLVPVGLCTKLCCTKLVQSLQNAKDSYVFLSLDSVLRETEAVMSAWGGWRRDLLVVVSEASEPHKDLCDILCRHLMLNNAESCIKKIIVVSALDDAFTLSLKKQFAGKCKNIEDNFEMKQLDAECRSRIENRDVSFQGVSIALGQLLRVGAEMVAGVFNDEFMKKVFEAETISLGPQLEHTISYYIPRTLERRDIISKDILQENSPNDVFIVLDSGDTVENTNLVLAKKENVHKVRMCSDGNLMWSSTKGSIDKISKFIREDSPTSYNPVTALDLEGRVILITAEPGMGKSTILTDLASKTKSAFPSFWVIRVDLKDHMDELHQLNDDVVGFLSSAVGISASSTENVLLRFMMETGKCVVLLDGFDEIAPDYTDDGMCLLTSLLKTKAQKIYVTSRHALKNELESHLQTLTFTLRKFDATDQRTFFKKFWTKDNILPTKIDCQLELLIERLVELIAQSLNDADKEFMGTPLLTMMLAEIYEDYFKKRNTQTDLPLKLDIITMFEQVIDKKFDIYLCKLHLDNVKNIQAITKRLLKSVTENHIHASLYLLIGIERLRHLHKGTMIIRKYEEFTETINDLEYQPGIIVKVLNGKPIFLHRTFAEYFTALWFAQNIDVKNQDFLCSFLYTNEFKVIRRFFDLMLARKSQLLTAVVNKDMESVEVLLSTGDDVNSSDLGGRSALHLGAVISVRSEHQYVTHSFWNRFVGPRPQSMVQLLLGWGAHAHGTDWALGWNVLEYAINTKSWQALEHLLGYLSEGKTPQCRNIWVRYDCLQWDDTLLETSCYEGDIDAAKKLISSLEVNLNLLCTSHEPASHINSDSLPRVSDALVKYINAQDRAGFSALFNASMKGHSAVICLLISKGANIWVREDDDETPLHAVFRYIFPSNSPSLVEESVDQRIDTEDSGNRSDLSDTSSRKNLDVTLNVSYLDQTRQSQKYAHFRTSKTDSAKALIANLGSDDAAKYVNVKNRRGYSALHYASRFRQSEDIELLVSSGGDIWTRDNEGKTPLHSACEVGNVDTARSLIESLAVNDVTKYINLKDYVGNSALCYSSAKRTVETIRLFVSKGGDVWARNNAGQTPLHVGCDSGTDSADATTALVANLAESEVTTYIDGKDDQGRTAIHYSSYMRNVNELKLFISKGGDVWALNDEGQTALHEVCKSYYSDVMVAGVLLESLQGDDLAKYINKKDNEGRTAKDLILANNFIGTSNHEMKAAIIVFLEDTLKSCS